MQRDYCQSVRLPKNELNGYGKNHFHQSRVFEFSLVSNERRQNVKFSPDHDEMVGDYLFRVEDREENVLSKKNHDKWFHIALFYFVFLHYLII